MPWFVLLNYTVSVTRVIIVTLALTDGEMFVSRDYNYNHSAILKLNSVVFDWPACWNQFNRLALRFCSPVGAVESTIAGSYSKLFQVAIFPSPLFSERRVDSWDKAADWPEPAELIFILACLRLEVMMPAAARDWWGADTSGENELWPLKSSAWREIDISV